MEGFKDWVLSVDKGMAVTPEVAVKPFTYRSLSDQLDSIVAGTPLGHTAMTAGRPTGATAGVLHLILAYDQASCLHWLQRHYIRLTGKGGNAVWFYQTQQAAGLREFNIVCLPGWKEGTTWSIRLDTAEKYLSRTQNIFYAEGNTGESDVPFVQDGKIISWSHKGTIIWPNVPDLRIPVPKATEKTEEK